jgi:hypothetical protein
MIIAIGDTDGVRHEPALGLFRNKGGGKPVLRIPKISSAAYLADSRPRHHLLPLLPHLLFAC